MNTTTTTRILATDIRVGQVLDEVDGKRLRRGVFRRWYCRLRNRDLVNGRPVVTRAEYELIGEDGYPTVYIESSELPGWTWCLRPDEVVNVVASPMVA